MEPNGGLYKHYKRQPSKVSVKRKTELQLTGRIELVDKYAFKHITKRDPEDKAIDGDHQANIARPITTVQSRICSDAN